MALFFKDLAKGRISMTDESAFEVGRNIAVTEGSVIFENELIQVIQYAPRTAEVFARPLVMIPPCINKFYILDLTPENSFVRHAVDQGHTVFMLSWRNITPETGHFTWDDYLQLGVMQAIEVARAVTGADDVNALGFCIGGTLLACATAVMKANAEEKVASMTLLTAMLDFAEPGEIGTLIDDQRVAAREAAIGEGGIMEGKELALTFSSLRANDLIWPYVVNSYLKGKKPPAFDLLYWNSDGTNLPGPMFCWYVRNTYLENSVREPGKTIQCGVPVDLSDIDVPAFIYSSREDHIVLWRAAYASLGPPRRRQHVRAGRERAHRRGDQSAGQEQAQLLGRRQYGRRRGSMAVDRARGSRQLVAGVDRLARPARWRQGRRAARPGKQAASQHRAGPGPLCEGQGRLIAMQTSRSRSRLAIEITVALVIKFLLLYVIWAVWFAHPVSRQLDARGVAATLFAVQDVPPVRRDWGRRAN